MLNFPHLLAAGMTDLSREQDPTTGAAPSNWTKDSLKAMPDYKDKRRSDAGGPPSPPHCWRG